MLIFEFEPGFYWEQNNCFGGKMEIIAFQSHLFCVPAMCSSTKLGKIGVVVVITKNMFWEPMREN